MRVGGVCQAAVCRAASRPCSYKARCRRCARAVVGWQHRVHYRCGHPTAPAASCPRPPASCKWPTAAGVRPGSHRFSARPYSTSARSWSTAWRSPRRVNSADPARACHDASAAPNPDHTACTLRVIPFKSDLNVSLPATRQARRMSFQGRYDPLAGGGSSRWGGAIAQWRPRTAVPRIAAARANAGGRTERRLDGGNREHARPRRPAPYAALPALASQRWPRH